jgi:putative addiction module component (TIGR02574 family)
MVAKNLLEAVFSLPVVDRMELFQRLRENLRNDPGLTPLSDAHKGILDERLADFESDPTQGSPWEEVEARIIANIGGA